MINELFRYLHPMDLAACSQVNRRWHSIYAGFRLHRLVAIDYESDFNDSNSRWKDTYQTIPEEQKCGADLFRRLAENPLLSNLKHLTLAGSKFEFDFNQLNRFAQLIRLEINIFISKKTVHLNLPKLRVLSFCGSLHSTISIDCPNLSEFTCNSYSPGELNVKHPETIKKLNSRHLYWKLDPFKSVQCLVTQRFEVINKTTFVRLPALKELHFNRDLHCIFIDLTLSGVTFNRMKQTLYEFLDQTKKLKGGDFQFTFAGFRLTKRMLNQIDFGVQVVQRFEGPREEIYNEYVYLKNYHLIEPDARLQFVYAVDYNRLFSISEELPCCFFEKFLDVDLVYAGISDAKDSDHLLWFLSSLRSPRRLHLRHAGLNQQFYDRLPVTVPSLGELFIKGFNELELNFEFIAKFPNLAGLSINQPLSLQSLSSLVGCSGKLAWSGFSIRLNELWCDVRKIRKDRQANSRREDRGKVVKTWKVTNFIPSKTLFQTDNPDEILNFVQRRNMPKRRSPRLALR